MATGVLTYQLLLFKLIDMKTDFTENILPNVIRIFK